MGKKAVHFTEEVETIEQEEKSTEGVNYVNGTKFQTETELRVDGNLKTPTI